MAKAKSRTINKVELKYPERFNVIILNDDYTPMDFVIKLIIEVFNKNIRRLLTSDKYSEAEAEDITNRMSNISTQHITTTFNSSQDVAFKTEKASKLFAKKANIKKPTNSI